MQGVDQQVVAPVSGRSVSLPETILASHISNGISTLPVVDSLHDHDLPIESESKVRGTMRRALNSRPALKFNRESTTKGTVIPRTCIVRIDRLIIPESVCFCFECLLLSCSRLRWVGALVQIMRYVLLLE